MLPIAIEYLVAGLTRYAEIPADVRHRLPVKEAGDKARALFHHRTRCPRHQHLHPAKGEKCYPCVRYEVSPMSRAAHTTHHAQAALRRARAFGRSMDSSAFIFLSASSMTHMCELCRKSSNRRTEFSGMPSSFASFS